MEQERKLHFFLIRLLMAGAICLVIAVVKVISADNPILEKVFEYLSSDIVFLKQL